MERRNGVIFFVSFVLIYLAAPVTYIGIVQAALCDKLGASYTIANLPASLNLLGNIAPLICAWLIPYRWERAVLVWSYGVSTTVLAAVGTILTFPFSNAVRIGALLAQGLIQGFSTAVAHAFSFQCLRRGTTTQGRAKIFGITFGFSPLTAVVGSLGAQFVLNEGISFFKYPFDFAFLYWMGVPCIAAVAFLSSRYQLVPVRKKKEYRALSTYLGESIKSFFSSRHLALTWIIYVLWYSGLSGMSNLSLYTKEAMGREPKEFSGLIMALRFGFKSAAGFVLGAIAVRWGIRAPLIITVFLVGAGMAWAWIVPGYSYLLSFGLLGAGELGGAYLPNYAVSISPAVDGARNMSVLALAPLTSSVAPATHGWLTDTFGFSASFAFAIATASLALCLVFQLPKLRLAKPRK